MEGKLSKLAFLDLTAVLARIIMSEKQNTIEFTITTSREYWEEKTYEEIKKATYLNPFFHNKIKYCPITQRQMTFALQMSMVR